MSTRHLFLQMICISEKENIQARVSFQESLSNLFCLVSAPNDGVKVSCDEEFYFKIDEVFDVGGTVSILAANSSYSVCLNQAPDESCPEDVTIESGKEGILTESGKGVNQPLSRLNLRLETNFSKTY